MTKNKENDLIRQPISLKVNLWKICNLCILCILYIGVEI